VKGLKPPCLFLVRWSIGNLKTVSNFLSNAPRLPKVFYFLNVSQFSPVCPCGKSNIHMKKSMGQWWTDTDRGKPKYSEKNLSHCHLVHQKPVSLPLRPPKTCLIATSSTKNLSHCHFVHQKPISLPLRPPKTCLIATSSTKNLSHCHFVHQKPHVDWNGIAPRPPSWEADN
jgi:hypothetical protein